MKEILYSICGAWVFVYALGMRRFKWKPLNCEKCMAGWICFGLTVPEYSLIEVPFMMAVSMVGVIMLTQIINRL